jgi:hypothetical protein
MLYSIFRNDQATPLLPLFLKHPRLDMFHIAVSFLNILNPRSTPLLAPIPGASPSLHLINKFYLLSLFQTIMHEFSGALFYRNAMPLLRRMAEDIAPYLLKHAAKFRSAPVGSPKYLAMLMVFSSSSPALQSILLGSTFPVWMSTFPRPHLIGVVRCPGVCLRLFMRGISDADAKYLSQLTLSTVSFISVLISEFHDRAKSGSFRMHGGPLLPLFEVVCTTNDVSRAGLLIPIARIFRSSDAITDFDDFNFQFDLRRILGKLCSSTTNADELALYPLRISALTILAANEETCLSMIQDTAFAHTIAKLLSSADMTILRKTWLFFQEITKFARVVSNLMAREQTAKPIAAVVNTDNHWVLRKFLEFSIHVLVNLGEAASRLFATAMIAAVGRISCIYSTRGVLFKDDASLVKLVEQYFDVVTSIEDPYIDQFLHALAKHISTAPPSHRTRSQTKKIIRSEMTTPAGLQLRNTGL